MATLWSGTLLNNLRLCRKINSVISSGTYANILWYIRLVFPNCFLLFFSQNVYEMKYNNLLV